MLKAGFARTIFLRSLAQLARQVDLTAAKYHDQWRHRPARRFCKKLVRRQPCPWHTLAPRFKWIAPVSCTHTQTLGRKNCDQMLLQIPSARTNVWIKIEPAALTCYCTSTPFLRYALALQVEIAVQLKYQDECQSLTWTENGSIKKHVIDHCCLGWFQWLCNRTLTPRLSRAVGSLAQVPKFHASCESWSKTPLVGAHSTGSRSSGSTLQQTWQMACQTTNGQETCGSRHIHI